MIDCESGIMKEPLTPWITRATTSTSSESAAPHSTDAAVKPATAPAKTRLRPKRALMKPLVGITIADATMYEVMTQEIWSCVAEKLPRMCGSATAAMVQSIE